MKVRELQAKKAEAANKKADALTKAGALLDLAGDNALTDEQSTQLNALKADAASYGAKVAQLEEQISIESQREAATLQAQGYAVVNGNGDNVQVTDNKAQDPKHGYKHAGEFFKSLIGAARAARHGGSLDSRLAIGAAAPSVYGNEQSGQDGGFLVPPEFAKNIFSLSLTDGALLPRTDNVEIEGLSMSFPKDETTPWGTNGIRAYWQAEGALGTATKPAFGLNTLVLRKLMGLVPVTDSLLQDAAALNGYIPKKVADSIQWKLNEAILFGQGGEFPLGAFASKAAITVAKDSGQATNTLTASNLANMVSRLPEGSFPNAAWIVGNDALPALFTLTLGNYPIYLPLGAGQGALADSPYGTLLGRPVIVSQHASAFSSAGDISLVDLSYYQSITKAGGMDIATSMHLYFDADATAFRTIFRFDGQSKLSAPIAGAKGRTTLSPFVQLGAR